MLQNIWWSFHLEFLKKIAKVFRCCYESTCLFFCEILGKSIYHDSSKLIIKQIAFEKVFKMKILFKVFKKKRAFFLSTTRINGVWGFFCILRNSETNEGISYRDNKWNRDVHLEIQSSKNHWFNQFHATLLLSHPLKALETSSLLMVSRV